MKVFHFSKVSSFSLITLVENKINLILTMDLSYSKRNSRGRARTFRAREREEGVDEDGLRRSAAQTIQ